MNKRIKLLSYFILLTGIINAQDVEFVKQLNTSFNKVIYNNFPEAKRIALQAVLESEKLQNDTLILESYINLSRIYFKLKLADSSLIYSNKGVKYAIKLNDQEKLAVLYNRKGRLCQKNGDFKASLDFHNKALHIAQSYGLVYLQVDVNINLAILYRSKRDLKQSFKVLKRAISIALLHNDRKGLAKSYNIKGLLFFKTNKDSVLHYYNKALKIVKADNNKVLQGVLLSNMGDFYINRENYEKAIVCLQEAEHISKSVGNISTLYYINVSQGIYHEEIDELDKAVKIYKKVLDDNKSIINDKQRNRLYWLLSGALWYNKEYKEAFDYQEKYIYLNDSIFNIEKEKEFETLRTQYEVEKKDNQIILLETENELASTRRKWIIISALLLAIPLIGLFLFYRHRAKTQKTIRAQESKLHKKEKERLNQEKKLKETQALIAGQDIESERIAKELHDGIGGQLASINLSLSHVNLDINNESLTQINQSLRNTFNELRLLSHNLSGRYHEDKPFKDLLAEFKHRYEHSNIFNLEISIFPEDCLQELNVYTKHNLYRILQELLTNVVKYAKAQLVELSFNKHDDVLIVMLEDDGKGFNVSKQKEGIGIKNIKERVMSIKGEITINSVINRGTSVTIEIPNEYI